MWCPLFRLRCTQPAPRARGKLQPSTTTKPWGSVLSPYVGDRTEPYKTPYKWNAVPKRPYTHSDPPSLPPVVLRFRAHRRSLAMAELGKLLTYIHREGNHLSVFNASTM
ncbi:hypothetical protein MRX96_028773 [Rhipicephalus microplus]